MFAPSRGRELKFFPAKKKMGLDVRPLAGAGIEITGILHIDKALEFAPSRGRELKYCSGSFQIVLFSSPPRGGGN